jgi:fructose-1,6-bisphosphatase/inositol monophosphatase family enzyme
LGSKFPQYRFLSEEVVVEDKFDFSRPVWIIDPIDWTANYTHGHSYVSISAALTLDGEPSIRDCLFDGAARSGQVSACSIILTVRRCIRSPRDFAMNSKKIGLRQKLG